MKLKKEFSNFYKLIRIDVESDVLIDKRRILEDDINNNFPDKLETLDIKLKKNEIEFFDQGSYKYNTTIKSNIVDRDVAVLIPLENHATYDDPRKIKAYLRDAIDIPARTTSIKEPCVRASYFENKKEYLHIDLPLYVDDNGNIFLARGKENGEEYSWQDADPKGLNDDISGKISGNDQLRRIICYIKRWRDVKYGASTHDHEIPPSIGLTYLACDCFIEKRTIDGDDDLLALQKTMKGIKDRFTYSVDAEGNTVSADIARMLTVKPYSDVFEKMRNSSEAYMLTFYNRICKAVDDLTNAVNVESEHDAGVYVERVLGSKFEIPEKKAESAVTQSKREHSFG